MPQAAKPSPEEALDLMRSALAILDETESPADIGAHLDLAICRLQEELDTSEHISFKLPALSHLSC